MKIAFLVVLLGVFLLPASVAVANHPGVAPSYILKTSTNQTIPLWGPTWGKKEVTVIIKANNSVSQAAIDMVEQSVADSNAAIHQGLGQDVPFVLKLVTEGKADITIRPKGGGGQIAGTAQQSSEGGIFTGCKINISGKAFGEPNDDDTILSIALQELWHCLGLLHSNDSTDIMYGTLQEFPNTQISDCDVQAFGLVMHWLLVEGLPEELAHSPHDPKSVECGNGGPVGGGGGGGGVVTGDLIVAVELVDLDNGSVTFENRDRVHIVATVTETNDDIVTLVEGALVNVRIVTPDPTKDLVGNYLTDEFGKIHTHYKVNAGRDGRDTYHVVTKATKDSTDSATCPYGEGHTALDLDCHTDFEVN